MYRSHSCGKIYTGPDNRSPVSPPTSGPTYVSLCQHRHLRNVSISNQRTALIVALTQNADARPGSATSPKTSFYRATLCISAVFAVARCPSVRPSVTLVDSIQTAEVIVNFFVGPVAQNSSFFDPERRYSIPREPLQQGHKIQGGGKILRFSNEISVCLGNSTRSAHGCYGTLIGSHMRSIEW